MADLKVRPVRFRFSFVDSGGVVLYAKEHNTDGTADIPSPQIGQIFEVYNTVEGKKFSGTVSVNRQYLEIDSTTIYQHIAILCENSQVVP